MDQERIWDYYQNSDLAKVAFPEARQRYLLGYLKPGQRVLNIGIGAGTLERLGIKMGVDMHSLDPSDKAINRLRDELGLSDKARSGYAQRNPFESDYFDVVVMSEVLEHLSDDVLSQTLSEVLRVLKKGGKFLATVPYKEDLMMNQVVCPNCGSVFHKVGHVQSFDKDKLSQLLTAKGFFVDRIWLDTFVDWRRGGVRNFVKSVIRKVLARTGEGIADPHLIVLARKQ